MWISKSADEEKMPVKKLRGSSDQFATVRTINTASNGVQDSSDLQTTADAGFYTGVYKA